MFNYLNSINYYIEKRFHTCVTGTEKRQCPLLPDQIICLQQALSSVRKQLQRHIINITICEHIINITICEHIINITITLLYALVLCYFYIIFIFILLHCPQSGPDLIYISLLIIPCIIYYVTNKETLNLDVNKCSVAEASCAEHDYCLMHSFDHSSKDGCICTWPASHLNAALGHTAPVPFLGRREKKREREREKRLNTSSCQFKGLVHLK